jgi:transcriptional regulator with XRE-family HTH domain
MTFLHKSIGGSEAQFGSDLKDLRELHGISFEQACRETKIDASILRLLEEDRILEFDDPIFAKRHLMVYIRYLGGYEPYFSGRFDAQVKEIASSRTTKDLLPRERSVHFWDLFVAPQFLAFLGIVLLAGIVMTYVVWQAHAVNTSPLLELASPNDGIHLETARVLVEGKTMSEATLTVNGQNVAVDEQGNFSSEFDVHRGTNVIRIVAKRRRGSETILERRVVFDRVIPEQYATSSTLGGASASSTTEASVTSTTNK